MFNINGEAWDIVLVPPFHPELFRSDGSVTLGSCDDITKTIYIDNALDGYLMKKVLAHEITHAAMFSYNVNLEVIQEELLADLIATHGQEIINITNKLFRQMRKEGILD